MVHPFQWGHDVRSPQNVPAHPPSVQAGAPRSGNGTLLQHNGSLHEYGAIAPSGSTSRIAISPVASEPDGTQAERGAPVGYADMSDLARRPGPSVLCGRFDAAHLPPGRSLPVGR